MVAGVVQILCIVLLFLVLPRLLWGKRRREDLENEDKNDKMA
jgi:hypothetical protein